MLMGRVFRRISEKASGALVLWLISLVIAVLIFTNSVQVYTDLSLNSIELFLTFFLIWGLIYTAVYAVVAIFYGFIIPNYLTTNRKR